MKLVLSAALAVLLVSCQSAPVSSPTASAELDETSLAKLPLRLVIEDLPSSFWKESDSGGGLFFSFFLANSGQLLTSAKVKEVSVVNEFQSHWQLEPSFYTTAVGGWFRCSDNSLSLDRTVLSLRKYTFDFQFRDGRILRKKIDPSSLIPTGGAAFLYSNDYTGKKSADFVATLSRPAITAASVSANLLTVEFAVNDARVKNFDVFLYDKNRDSLVDSPAYVNDLTGQVAKALNGGQGFYVDGRTNRLVMDAWELGFPKGKGLTDLKYLVLNVTDAATVIHTGDSLELQTKSERFTVN